MIKGPYSEFNQEFLEIILPLDLIARKLLIPLLFLVAVLAATLEVRYPLFPLFVLIIIFAVMSEVGLRLIKWGLVRSDLGYFTILLIDCLLVAVATYYSGGIESFLPILYIVIGVMAGLTLPLASVLAIMLAIAVCYMSVPLLETFRLIPHVQIFPEFFGQELYPVSNYIRLVPPAYYIIFVAIILIAYNVANMLKHRKERLHKLNIDLGKSAQALAQTNSKLDNKIRELEELGARLETKVSERTKALEESKIVLEDKLAELKSFHDLAVDRELKMIKLEKEIDDLKKEAGPKKEQL